MNVLCRSCRRGLHTSCSVLSCALVKLQSRGYITSEVLLPEHNTQTGSVFDRHTCPLTLMWHHLFSFS